ncbi:Na+/H+ antiporter subunit E [Fuchsiella alkaliacetigena]|uniref:Na+/H+ antiporter subunit E n=1 Tax=Fuchsiella alkaliacetigena TaxID=957042 RepID=UPI00200A2936|nr:Na+/H+ antiporter subunit E [Fuchsiella alkaliacetigena]MCK8825928.1 Na+/H+ antiporter subunit E [Fuchsiella alkaliacetigena]
MAKKINGIFIFIILYVIWFIVSGNFSLASIVVGGLAAILPAKVISDYFVRWSAMRIVTKFFIFVAYLLLLLKEVMASSLNVAYIVLHPRMPFNPGIVKVPTGFEGEHKGIAMSFLGNTVTLTPGTMTLDLDTESGDLYIHWLDVKTRDPEEMRKTIYGKFESLIGRILT